MTRRSLFRRLKVKSAMKRDNQEETINEPKITTDLDENMKTIKDVLGNPADLVVRELIIGEIETRAAIVYLSGITEEDLLNDNIMKAIQQNLKRFDDDLLENIRKEVIAVTDIKNSNDFDDVCLAVLNGDSAFYLDGSQEVLLMGTSGGQNRSIEEPDTETLIRGPRDGFVESMNTNMALIRRDIKIPNLRFEQHTVGGRSKQKLVVCHVEGLAHPELVEEVNRRIKSIDLDYVTDSSFVEQWIEDSFLSPFPQVLDTERPDVVSASVMQGKVGIIVDGSPFALIAPMTFNDGLSSPEDYTQRWLSASSLRLLRFLAAFIAIFLPGLYVALATFHPGMIPSTLAYSIAASREGVPFPAVIEAILMALTFELLHEAGIRLPNVIGQTIGIVGGLVIGEAAVNAGIVSPIMVIITALTAIASFSIPSYSLSMGLRTLRFIALLAAGTLGLYGIILVFIMIVAHIVNLKSFGIPYTAPFGPLYLQDLKDGIIRVPMTDLPRQTAHLKMSDAEFEYAPNEKRKNKKR